MSADPFDAALSGIFARSEQALNERLDKVRVRAETLQAEDTSRLAFTLTETIEHALEPAIEEALDRYDEALGQPPASNPRWEEAVRARIPLAVDAGVRQALSLDQLTHPWKPLLKAEAPKLSERLVAKANVRLAEIHKTHGPRRRRTRARREWSLRFALLALGVVLGAMIRSLF
jgi:hypothetical protein